MNSREKAAVSLAGQTLMKTCHAAATESGWWTDRKTGEDLHIRNPDGSTKYNVPEKLMLIVSEIAEGMEGHRKNLVDTHLPQYYMLDVELADAVIRIADLAGALGINLGYVIAAKLEYNATREDHKLENRRLEGGKAF